MTHTLAAVSRRVAARLLAAPPRPPERLRVECLERRDTPAGSYSGFVFQDFNANGARDVSPTAANTSGNGVTALAQDRGIAGVVVTAYAGSGQVGQTVTDAAGAYALTVAAPAALGPYRLEFTGLPAGLTDGPAGPDSKTTAQFVPDGGAADASVGLTRAGEYAQDLPLIVAGVYQFGDPAAGPNANAASIVGFPVTAGGTTGGYTGPTARDISIPYNRVGAVYGLGFDPFARDLYASAYFKRHTGFGSGGTGGIYRANVPTGPLSNYQPPGAASLEWANLNSIFGAGTAGPNQHDTLDDNNNGLVDDLDTDNGNTGWAAVGTTGLGGLDVSDDGRYVFVMNLADRQLYRLPTSGPLDATTVLRVGIPLANPDAAVIPDGDFHSEDLRPFAVQYHDGEVYVGVVYSAQTLAQATGGSLASTAARDQLLAAVYKLNPETMQFESTAPAFTARLNYPRSQSATGFDGANNGPDISPWRAWSPTYFRTTNNAVRGVAPQPMLSDISFDPAGNMTLGLRDRGSDQIGNYNLSDPNNPTTEVEGYTTGDMLQAFLTTPNNPAGGWTLESNGRGPAGQGTGPQNNNAGPGGAEFYFNESFGTSHGETTMGGLLQLPGRPDVISAQMDPATTARSGGFSWMNTTTGRETKAFQLYATPNANNTTFSKANGLGGVTAVLDLAPTEVGDRVFRDSDRDGVQDPSEPAIPGVLVELLDANGNVIDTATTALDGTYYFTSAAGTASASRRTGVPFVPGDTYTVRVPNAVGGNRQTPLALLVPTLADNGGAGAGSDLRDSDGVVAVTASIFTFVAGQPGENTHAIDFGFRTPGSTIGGLVYYDANNDGNATGDAVITTPVQIRLTGTDVDGNPVDRTVTTSSGGGYSFADVPPTAPGTSYTLTQLTQPAGYLDGRDTPGTPFNGAGSGTAAGDVITAVVVPNDGQSRSGSGYNFGELLPASLGNFVWLDANGNGQQDTSEAGVNGVTVTLSGTTDRGTVTATTVTANGGLYGFTNLRPGSYTVTFGNTANGTTYTRTYRLTPAGLTATDSNADRTTGAAAPVALAAGQSDPTIDAGLYLPVSLGDRVWFDTDADGRQDAGEPGIVGATVTVTYAGPDGAFNTGDDSPVTTTATGTNGVYTVGNLPPGTYRVSVDPSTGTVNGTPVGTVNPTYDLDGAANGLGTAVAAVPSALTPPPLFDAFDFGYTSAPGALGDLVWLDIDADGVRDAGEPGLAGITVTALWAGPDGNFTTVGDNRTYTTATDANGAYGFAGLPVGTYRVTAATAGTNLRTTFDLDGPAGTPDGTAVVTLTLSSPTNFDVDFGVVGTARVGDLVWYDVDGNGVQNNAEPGIAGAAVTLRGAGADNILDNADDLLLSTTTDASGNYLFAGLPVFAAGTPYRVTVTPPALYSVQTFDADGLASANTSLVTLTPGAPGNSNLAQDFGYRGPLAQGLGDFVWLDDNGNGRQDAAETGINGVTVELLDAAGQVLATTTTTGAPNTSLPGYYEFRGLAAGTYSVRFGNTANGVTYTRTQQSSPVATSGDDSNASAVTGQTDLITLPAGTFDPTIDAGLYRLAALGDTVWFDADRNGVQNGTEPGLANVTVILDYAGPDGVFGDPDDVLGLATTATNASGVYGFSDLRPGTYRVTVAPNTLPAGLSTQTYDLDGLGSADTATAALASNQTRLDVDFGYVGTATLGDTVWYDLDRNGAQNNNEPGIAGVTVTLTWAGPNGVFGDADDFAFAPQTTDAQGRYLFTGLPAGRFRATVTASTLPAGVPVNTFDLDNGTTGANGTADTTLTPGQNRRDVDFGYVGTGSIGDTVYSDTNGDGVQGPGEPGVPGVQVGITWAGPDNTLGTPDDVTRTTTTGAGGVYTFDGLPPGTYTVAVLSPPPGATQTGDPDGVRDNTTTVVLTPAQIVTTADFGYQGNNTLGGTVFVDSDRDGVRGTGEPVIPGVTVTLSGTDVNGNAVTRATTTNAFGQYVFTNLQPGNYTLTETQPTRYADGGDRAGTVNGAPTGTAGNDTVTGITLGVLQSGINYDFGELGGTVTGTVFIDHDDDGVKAPNEPGIVGVVVTIRTPTGDVIATATTNPNGTYTFTDLPAGPYTITESQPAGTGNPATGPGGPNVRTVELTPGGIVAGQDFGDTFGTLSGTVFVDADNDGVRGATEPTIPNVTLVLLDGVTGTVLATTTTDGNGFYRFTDLVAGPYAVVEFQPAGYLDGQDTPGTRGGVRSGPDGIAGIPVPAGGVAPGNDFGEVVPATVAGTVFLDTVRDGAQTPGEPGIPNVTVQLVDANGTVVATTITDGAGNYLFTNVFPGVYTVQEVQPGALGTTPNTGENLRTVTVAPGSATVAVSFPDTLGTIAGTVYLDTDLSGTRNTGADAGLAGITVTLLDAAGNVVAVTTTDRSGNYRFTGLPAGTYAVVETQPGLPTTLTNGFYDGSDNPGNLGGTGPTKNATRFTLPAGADATGYDFGELPPADPFGFVFVDINRDNTRGPTEPGIPGVAITISGTAFAGTPFARALTAADVPGGLTTRTDANGRWQFVPQPPGLYTFTEAQPAGYADGAEQVLDTAGPNTVRVGGDEFGNVVLNPGAVRGPFNFGELLVPATGPLAPMDFFPATAVAAGPSDMTKREFLGSTRAGAPAVGTTPADTTQATGPNFRTATTIPTYLAVAEDAGGGMVRVFDYQSGIERFRFRPFGDFTGGVHVATGDVTGDGVPDVVVTPGAGGGPIVRVFDGLTGAEIANVMAFEETFRGGLQLAVGDLDGDGRADIVVAPDVTGGPIVRAFSGRTFQQTANFFALDETFRGGLRLATGDLNADGRADVVVTAGVGGGPGSPGTTARRSG